MRDCTSDINHLFSQWLPNDSDNLLEFISLKYRLRRPWSCSQITSHSVRASFKMRFFLLLILSFCCLQDVLSGNILAVLPMPLYSHTMPFIPIIRALADKGHNVTFISPFPQKTTTANFHNIKLNSSIAKMQGIAVVLVSIKWT